MKYSTILFFLTLNLILDAQVICIDPGHGYGPDGENLDGRTTEEIFTNCEVGLILRDSLEKRGYDVIMTRESSDTNSWLSLTQRAEIADEYESDRLLSIHCNGGGGTGTETFWCYRSSPNKAIDSIFSQLVQDEMSYYGEWRSRRSIEDALYLGFHLGVLKGSTPGCLNEIGFVDTPSDLEKLEDTVWQQKFAMAYRIAIDLSFEQDYPSRVSLDPEQKIKIFPNPCKDYIILSGFSRTISILKIYNLMGEEILSYDLSEQLQNEFGINTSALCPGVYLLSIYQSKNNQSVLFIKQ